jgi:mannose-6-phosphate isomerase-like protein (cupin superfamily)
MQKHQTQSAEAPWRHVRPDQLAWAQFPDPDGRPTTPVRELLPGAPYVLEADFPPDFEAGLHWHPHDTLYLITAGEMRVGQEGVYRPGDLRWVKAGHVYGPERAGPQGVRFFLVSLGGPIGLNWADLHEVPAALERRLAAMPGAWGRVHMDAVPWQEFPDAAGRPTQPVQVLCDTDPYILRTRFVPGFSAGQHWHDFDTLYFITRGRMRFGEEGWYEAGDLRWVRGGYSYGPEEPGPEGVEFVLVSCGGPVALRWADLEPPPRGALPVGARL